MEGIARERMCVARLPMAVENDPGYNMDTHTAFQSSFELQEREHVVQKGYDYSIIDGLDKTGMSKE